MDKTEYKYLAILDKLLDDAQQKVCQETKNSVIAAGAGSGKTQVLATRFAWLVISKNVPATEILTLTFTNKAAAEMYQRIYATLYEFAYHKELTQADFEKKNWDAKRIQQYKEGFADLTPDKRKRAEQALADFAGTHIQTLDSYCGNIVRQCSNRYGIRPDFTVGSSDGTSQIKQSAFNFVLKNLHKESIKKFFKPGKIQDFSDSVFADTIKDNTSLATPDGYFSKKFQLQSQMIVDAWNFFVNNKEKTDSLLDSDFSINTFLKEITALMPANPDDSDKPDYIRHVQRLTDWTDCLARPALTIEDLENQTPKVKTALETYAEFRNVYETVKNPPMSGIQVIKTKINEGSKDPDSVLSKVDSLVTIIKNYNDFKEMNQLLDEFLEETNKEKRLSGNLSFGDVTELALKVLIENPDIRNQERKAFSKIMIDEFQDNNGKNRDLLYLLSMKDGYFENDVLTIDEEHTIHDLIIKKSADGTITEDYRDTDKLFFVGDEKQSIYKFRGAEVSVFNELSRENQLLQMSYNYRSTPELIKSFNILFENPTSIFDKSRADVDYEAQYKDPAKKNGMDVLPELTINNVPAIYAMLDSKKFDSKDTHLLPAKEQKVYYIAKTIRTIIDEAKAANPDAPQIPYGSFAILDKSRTDRNLFAKYLSMFNIPYQMDLTKNIFEEGIVNDFYNFLRICVYPSDINAWATYLASPLSGLAPASIERFFAIVLDTSTYKSVFDIGAIDEQLEARLSEALGDVEYQKLRTAIDYYRTTRKAVLEQPLTSTVSNLWNELGYKYETMLNEQTNLCAEQFDMLYELSRTADDSGKSAAWFIDQLDRTRSTFTKEDAEIDAENVAYPLESESVVQIMTIHKSKGLQFDYVFIYGCTNCSTKSDNKQAFFQEDTGVSLKTADDALNYFFIRQKKLSGLKELAEFRRLIYVAITRAVKKYWMIGEVSPGSDSSSLLRLIEKTVNNSYPAFSQMEDGGLQYVPGAAFGCTEICPVKYSDLPTATARSSSTLRKTLFESVEKALEKSDNLVSFTSKPRTRMAPSHSVAKAHTPLFFKSSKKDEYEKLTELFTKYNPNGDQDQTEEENSAESQEDKDIQLQKNEFSAAAFGTMVHDYLDKMAQGIEPESYEPPSSGFKNVEDPEDRQLIKQICCKMCSSFKASSLWAEYSDAVKNNRFAKSEYAFKYFDDDVLYTGSIDLIFKKADGTYMIVDYKTDRTISPDHHFAQQSCYKSAAQLIIPDDAPISCALFYLRFDEIVPLDI